MTRIICFDFDGVIHNYESGWKGATVIPDEPVYYKGRSSVQWLTQFMAREDGEGNFVFDVCIYSSRSKEPGGIEAMKEWLSFYGMSNWYLRKLKFPTQKPAAFITIDDRALTFEGVFFTPEEVLAFRPWSKR